MGALQRFFVFLIPPVIISKVFLAVVLGFRIEVITGFSAQEEA